MERFVHNEAMIFSKDFTKFFFWKENSKCHSSCAQFSDSSGIIAVLAEGCVSWIMWNIREIMIFGPFAPSFINAGQLMMINIIQTFSMIEGDFKQDHPKNPCKDWCKCLSVESRSLSDSRVSKGCCNKGSREIRIPLSISPSNPLLARGHIELWFARHLGLGTGREERRRQFYE